MRKLFVIVSIALILILSVVIYNLYLGRGIMAEAYMVATHHKKEVISFYLKNNYCPLKKEDTTIKFAESVYIETGKKGICNIRVNMRQNTPVFGNKTFTLSLQFDNTSKTYKTVCSTNTFSVYLPNACK